jgi:hypothetical protein
VRQWLMLAAIPSTGDFCRGEAECGWVSQDDLVGRWLFWAVFSARNLRASDAQNGWLIILDLLSLLERLERPDGIGPLPARRPLLYRDYEGVSREIERSGATKPPGPGCSGRSSAQRSDGDMALDLFSPQESHGCSSRGRGR